MGRPVYPHELCDPDFSWLITNFQESNPNYRPVERGCLPVVLICDGKDEPTATEEMIPKNEGVSVAFREIIENK